MAKVIGVVVGGLLLLGALLVSIAFFAVALTLALIVFGYFWWKTRAIRRQMREQLHAQAQPRREYDSSESADVIEGVVISRAEYAEADRRRPEDRIEDGSSERARR